MGSFAGSSAREQRRRAADWDLHLRTIHTRIRRPPVGGREAPMSQAPAQLTINRPPEPVSQMPEQLAVGRHAHEGVAPHPAGNAKQA
jgi:hypothetical protein